MKDLPNYLSQVQHGRALKTRVSTLSIPSLDVMFEAGHTMLHLLADGLPAGVPIFDERPNAIPFDWGCIQHKMKIILLQLQLQHGQAKAEYWRDDRPVINKEIAGELCIQVKRGWFISDLVYTPTGKVLVEAPCTVEHATHVGHTAGDPAPDVLVELPGTVEHGPHVGHTAGDPAPDVLVEVGGTVEDGPHVGHTAGVPAPDVLVEAAGNVEHGPHGGHLAGVPAPDVLVEGAYKNEQGTHVRDPGRAGQSYLLVRWIIINKIVQLGPGPFGVGIPIDLP
eukprot:scaffold1313_cov349-Pavlova_lutheri.AAC.3